MRLMDLPKERTIMIPDAVVDADVENRILRQVVFCTRRIAQDGGIVLPAGMQTDVFENNGQILARHARAVGSGEPMVIGRPLGLVIEERRAMVDIEFADTALGREYAYLWGCNKDKRAYARGWSFGWNDIDATVWDLAKARRELGADYDADRIPVEVKKTRKVWVVTRSLLKEITATPQPADLDALTQAAAGGIREAGRLAAEIELQAALADVSALRRELENDRQRLSALERAMAALRDKAIPSVAQGNDGEDAIIVGLNNLLRDLCNRHKQN